jgi:hypothetical protein
LSDGLPDLKLLAARSTPPVLQLVHLAQQDFEPWPVRLDQMVSGPDGVVVRDGWLAFGGQEIWGTPSPPEGKAFFVGEQWGWGPGRSARTIMYGANRADPEAIPSRFVEYDGIAREIVDTIEIERGLLRLAAVVPLGLVLWSDDGLRLREWDDDQLSMLVEGWVDVHASWESLLVLTDDSSLSLLDVETGRRNTVPKPPAGEWSTLAGAFSPDGAYYAVDFVEGEESRRGRLALIRCADGDVIPIAGEFEGGATGIVWSDDGEWIVFHASGRRALRLVRVADLETELVPFRRAPPTPLADLTRPQPYAAPTGLS